MGDEKRHVDHLEEAARKAEADLRDDLETVSYTHLTLPTIA